MAGMLNSYQVRAQNFRRALCKKAEMSAVVTQTEQGVQIGLSDGRVRLLRKDVGITADAAVALAVHWARRQGATSIEIDDS